MTGELIAAGHLIGLRRLRVEDVDATYVSWLNDPEVTRFTEARFAEHTLESQRAWVEEHAARADTLLLAIVELPERFVGTLKLGPLDRHHGTAELGIMIGATDCWGRGYATEAISLATPVGFELLGARKLFAGCYAGNQASGRAFLRAGWSEEGALPGQFVGHDGELHDHVRFGIFRN